MTKTEQQICETLIDIMEDTPLSKIKVTELTRQAGVSRSTFYNYYDSIFEVVQAIEDDFLSHIVDEKDVGTDNDADVVAANFSYVRDHLRVFQILLGPNGDPSFTARFGNRSKRILASIAGDSRSNLTETQLAILDEFAMAGKLRVFQWWAQHKNDVSVNEIIDMLDRVTTAIHHIVTG